MTQSSPDASSLDAPSPLVSILIPCWGCRSYIGKTIRSALSQTYNPIEIVVTEDAGVDGTYEAAKEFERDPRVRVFRNEANLGQHRNKNRALSLARGLLIKFLDGDDLLTPDCVETLVGAWRSAGRDAGFVAGLFTIIDQHDRFLANPAEWGVSGRFRGPAVLGYTTARRWPGSVFGNPTPILFRRDVLERTGGFPDDHSWAGDMETYYRVLCETDVVFVNRRIAKYRLQPGNVTATRKNVVAAQDNITMVKRLAAHFAARPHLPSHLRDPAFIADWKIWACEGFLIPHYWRKRRGRANEYDELLALYEAEGLGEQLEQYIRRRFVSYVIDAWRVRLRRILRMPQHAPFFGRRFLRMVRGTEGCV